MKIFRKKKKKKKRNFTVLYLNVLNAFNIAFQHRTSNLP